MMEDKNYPDRVPREERPDATVESVPKDVLDQAIEWAVDYAKCSNCAEPQFYPILAGHNTEWDCRKCGEPIRVVG